MLSMFRSPPLLVCYRADLVEVGIAWGTRQARKVTAQLSGCVILTVPVHYIHDGRGRTLQRKYACGAHYENR